MKNKFFTISIIFILFSFIFINNSVFAYNETFTYNDAEYVTYMQDEVYSVFYELDEYKAGYKYFCYAENNRCNIFFFDNSVDIKIYFYNHSLGNDSVRWGHNLEDMTAFKSIIHSRYIINQSTFELTSINVNDPINTAFYSNSVTSNQYFGYHFFTNMNIYDDETFTSFFFKAPVTEQPEEELTLAEIMKTAGEQATMEMGQIILIVIATTAGLIILLIGLKKGLKVLMNGFRH